MSGRLRWFLPRVAGALLAFATAGCGAGVMPAIHSDSERLVVARQLHDKGDDAPAIELLKAYVAGAAGTAQVDEAIYLLGDCYLKTREWTLAQSEFERLLRDYPESDSSGAASFRLGDALVGQSRPRDFDQEFTVKAIDQWNRYLEGWPGHWLNDEAKRRLVTARTRLARKLVDTGNLYLKLKLPDPARVYFQRVVDEFPETTATANAEFGLALADVRQGKREAAISRLRTIETRFAGQEVAQRAAHERKRLEKRS